MVSYQQGSRFRALSLWGCVCKDWETKKMVIVQSSFWSSFWAAFHFRIFEVCSCSAWYLLLLAHSFWMLLEAWFHADINLLDECLQIQNRANMYIKSHRFLCHPYRSWEFHDHIKYQCPGVTVPNGRRFWRALIYRCNICRESCNNMTCHDLSWLSDDLFFFSDSQKSGDGRILWISHGRIVLALRFLQRFFGSMQPRTAKPRQLRGGLASVLVKTPDIIFILRLQENLHPTIERFDSIKIKQEGYSMNMFNQKWSSNGRNVELLRCSGQHTNPSAKRGTCSPACGKDRKHDIQRERPNLEDTVWTKSIQNIDHEIKCNAFNDRMWSVRSAHKNSCRLGRSPFRQALQRSNPVIDQSVGIHVGLIAAWKLRISEKANRCAKSCEAQLKDEGLPTNIEKIGPLKCASKIATNHV